MALTRTETTQADWQTGTLSGVVATSGGDLVLEGSNGTNVALGKTYTKSLAPKSNYPDTNNSEFTDGVEGTAFSDGKSFGYSYTELGVADGGVGTLEITVDLGVNKWINKATLASGDGDPIRKYEADTLEILTSSDGTIFTSRGSVGTLNTPTKYLTVSFSPVKARYVKFRIKKDLAPAGSQGDNLFIMEGYVYECYAQSGARISPAMDLSSVGTAASSKISWTATTPASTSVAVDVSLDGGTTWQSAANGGAITGITPGMNLSGKSLLVRQTLSTTDPTVTPTMSDLTVRIGSLQTGTGAAQGSCVVTGSARRFVFAVASASTGSTMDWNEHIQAVSATATAGATLDVDAIRLLIQMLVINAVIQPGDIVEIDTAKMVVKINGVNALPYVEGDFFSLLPGTNHIEYQDSETQRNVQVITRHRPRWI